MPSVFAPGTSSLDAVTLPAAVFEAARLLDAAENSRNANNPGLAPKQNIAATVDFGSRTAAISATIPATISLDAAGKLVIDASDYLGAPYSTFAPGGDVKSTDVASAFLEVAQQLATAEKLITPLEDQPNNISVTYEGETGSVTVTANLPIVTATTTTGDVVITAVDYL